MWLAYGEKHAPHVKMIQAEITNWFQIQVLNQRLECISGGESFLSLHLRPAAQVADTS